MAKNSIEQMNPGKQGLADILNAQFGSNGHRFVTSTKVLDADERYYFIQALEDSVFSAKNSAGGDDAVDESLSAGLYITGVYSEVVVTSGKIIAYIL